MSLADQLAFAAALIDHADVAAPAVSRWSVGQHLEHVAKANTACMAAIRGLAAGEGDAPGGKPTLAGRVVLATGWIPRGRGEAPEFTVPEPQPSPDALRAAFEETRAATESLPPLPRDKRTRPHPALGHFTAKQWLRFAAIHVKHHLAIIREIQLKAALAGPRG